MTNASSVLVAQLSDDRPTTLEKPTFQLDRTSVHSALTSSLSFNSEDDFSLPRDIAERLVRKTEDRVSEILGQAPFLKANFRLYNLPLFEREHIDVGDMLAYGGFSTVYAINSFHYDNILPGEANQYILKTLTPKLALNAKKLIVGAKDIVMEAHFLSALKHENIIELRGVSAAGVAGFSETCRADGFFLIYDRLEETLGKRILNWRGEGNTLKKSNLSTKGQKCATVERAKLFVERLRVAIDIAEGLKYLHEKRILYRDMKPANVGFDSNGVVKIFDFGLAVELPEGSSPHSTYNLAGNTGTSRYMAVEIIRKEPYNLKADVFSFSIVLWEMIALAKPYDGMPGNHVKEVVSTFGDRPEIPRSWPSNLRKLLKKGWSENLIDRADIVEMQASLEKIHRECANLAVPKKKGLFSFDRSSNKCEGKSRKGLFVR